MAISQADGDDADIVGKEEGMENVLLVKGQSQYNAMRNYIDEIEVGFRLAGYNTIVIDSQERSASFQLVQLEKYIKFDLIFTCNAMNTELIGELPGARYVTYLCDHPATHRERLKRLDEKSVVFTCDIFYAEYVKEYYPNIKCVVFVPLSGSYSKKYIPYHERKYDVVFTGTYKNPQDFYEETLAAFPEENRELVGDMMKGLVNDPHQRRDICLQHILKEKGVVLPKDMFDKMCHIMYGTELYARIYYRDKMVRVLLDAGLEVYVFGHGWEELKGNTDNLHIETGNFYIAQKAVADAKISINIMPWFKGGFQERIASAMLSGAVAVTDGSTYIDENFEDGRELVVYSLNHLEELPEKVKWLLEHPELAERIACQGKERAGQELTWQHRTFEMIQVLKNCPGDAFLGHIAGKWGTVLRIPYDYEEASSMMGADIRNGLDGILALADEIQAYGTMEIEDLKYLYTRFLYLYIRINAVFPEIQIDENIESCIYNADKNTLQSVACMFIKVCQDIRDRIKKF